MDSQTVNTIILISYAMHGNYSNNRSCTVLFTIIMMAKYYYYESESCMHVSRAIVTYMHK